MHVLFSMCGSREDLEQMVLGTAPVAIGVLSTGVWR
jgi:hypothetical protein